MVLNNLKQIFNDIKLSINSDIQVTKSTAHFLDIWVTLKNNRFITSLYQKPMNEFQYLPCSSAHPRHILTGWITGELTRIKRLSTLEIDYHTSKNLFYHRLLQRCYPKYLLNNIFEKHLFNSNYEKLIKPKTITFIMPFSTRNTYGLQKLITNNKKLFVKDINMELMTSWSVSRNLSSMLTTSYTESPLLMELINIAINDSFN
jgi:hypothetical protein